jgi:hypothetical protein
MACASDRCLESVSSSEADHLGDIGVAQRAIACGRVAAYRFVAGFASVSSWSSPG